MNGRLIASGCEKEASVERVVERISKVGIPSLIATDVNPPPYFVMKVAARFAVRVFFPQRNMNEEEKKSIGREMTDVHIRDAYAAAVKAYREYANRFRQIELLEMTVDKDKLKHMVLQGYKLSTALSILSGRKE